MAEYYADVSATTGTGTEGDPYGPTQLITALGRPGVALDALQQGDTLYLGGGTYDFATHASDYNYGVLCPAATDCTIRSKTGEKAIVRRISGKAPLAGSYRQNGFIAHRTRFLGIEFVEVQTPADLRPLVRIIGHPSTYVEGCEVGYCRVIAGDLLDLTVDNHECVRLDSVRAARTHHCELTGAKGKVGDNPAGYKEYHCEDCVCEDNWIHGNNNGVYYKTNVHRAICRRNFCVANVAVSGTTGLPYNRDFNGTGYTASGGVYVYDNIFDSELVVGEIGKYFEIHHNLIRNSTKITHHGHNNAHSHHMWNNIQLSPTNACNPWWSQYTAYPGSPPALLECDYNLVVSQTGGTPVPTYPYSGQNFTLTTFRAEGFEVHSQFPAGGLSAIFDDPATYALKAIYLTAGRDGDIIGPHDPALLLDTSRYGPEALIALETDPGTPATALTLTGPSTATLGEPSGAFWVDPNGTFAGIVTMTDRGAGGTFTPPTLTWGSGPSQYNFIPQTFTYTPAIEGQVSIGITNDADLDDPPDLTLTVFGIPAALRAFPTRFMVGVSSRRPV